MDKLNSAAPELLEACIEALSLFDNHPELFENIGTYELLIRAIHKATGNNLSPFNLITTAE
jgi:hypothetical protein